MPEFKAAVLTVDASCPPRVQVIKGTKSAHDFGSISSPETETTTLTVTGAALGDPVLVAPGTSVAADSLLYAWVSATDTVSIRAVGVAGTADFASQDFVVYVLKFKQF